jgi:ketosteroid isomerase-like protein
MTTSQKASAPPDSRFELVIRPTAGSGSPETAARNRQALEHAYRVMLSGDMSALFALLAPDVQFHEAPSLPYGVSLTGSEAAKQGVAGMFSAWSELHIEIEELVAGGDLVIAYIQMRAVSRASGEVYEGPVAEVFRFRDGKIVEWRPIYWDTHRVRQVCRIS